jgi:hypothetical protein
MSVFVMASVEINFQVTDCFNNMEIKKPHFVISGFRCGVHESVALLGCYAA